MSFRIRIAILSTHPVPYHAPLFKKISQQLASDLMVFYDKDFVNGFSYDQDVLPPDYLGQNNALELISGYEWTAIYSQPRSAFDKINQIGAPWRLVFAILRWKPDVILIFGYKGLARLFFLVFGRHIRITTIFKGEVNRLNSEIETQPKALIKRWMLRNILKRVSFATTSCANNREYLKCIGIDEVRQIFVPCAVDNLRIFDWQQKALIKFDYTKPLRNFIFVGALEHRKNPTLLVYEMAKFAKLDPNIRIKFVGSGSLEKLLRTSVDKLQIPSNVTFTGYLPEEKVFEELAWADAIILPSFKDPSPKVLNEAMCFGLLCIVSDQVGTVGDLIKDQDTGLVFNPNKKGDLQRAVEWAFLNREAVEEIRKNAYKEVTNWTFDAGVENLMEKIHTTKLHSKGSVVSG